MSKIKSIVFFAAGVNSSYKTLLKRACEINNTELRMIGHSCMGGAKELSPLLQIATSNYVKENQEKVLIEPVFSQESSGQLSFF